MDNQKRSMLQGAAALLQNANFKGFFTGKIYQGPVKNICVPGLNCYSCPGAVGACPIGSLQNTLSSYRFKFPYYVLGLLIFFGAVFGRLICGFICPFGFLQDLLFRVPFFKKLRTFKGDRPLRKLKYFVLLFLVILLPVFVKLTPVFCKYLCPSGTLSGILLACADSSLFRLMGGRFLWKVSILAAVLLASLLIARPFCKYLCPLGAFYAPFNKVAFLRMQIDRDRCVHCGKCSAVCVMNVDPSQNPDDPECIRCTACIEHCPQEAISFVSAFRAEEQTASK